MLSWYPSESKSALAPVAGVRRFSRVLFRTTVLFQQLMASSATPIPAARSSVTGATSVIHTDLDYKPSYLAAGLASLAVFALYMITLAPSTAMWDASENIAAAYVLGLPTLRAIRSSF